MKVRVPPVIRIGIHDYKILLDDHIAFDSLAVGQSRHRDGEIAIDCHQNMSQRYVTFLHEVLEVIRRKYTINLDHDDLDRIAQGMAELLHNNLHIKLDWSDISGEEK